jgi:hypothetical protein
MCGSDGGGQACNKDCDEQRRESAVHTITTLVLLSLYVEAFARAVVR